MEKEHLINATCPECRGPLTEITGDGLIEFRCLVGHRYSPQALLTAHSETQERALWAAALALEEAGVIAEEAGRHLAAATAEELNRQARQKHQQAQTIREVLEQLEPFHVVETTAPYDA
jgi:two-component system chemotaxis response regulator CheB